MAAKVSTIILDVDLDCHLCCKKIKKILRKFPEIQSQTFDEKQNKVIITGAFDPDKLMKKICCKACKYIKSFEIIIPQPPTPKPGPTKPDPPPQKPATPPPESASKSAPVPDLTQATRPPEPEPKLPKPLPEPKSKPDTPAQEPVKENPQLPPPPPGPVKEDPPLRLPPSLPLPVPGIPIGPYGPLVCCGPCYDGHHEQGICKRYGYQSGCRFFSDEDPYCRTM